MLGTALRAFGLICLAVLAFIVLSTVLSLLVKLAFVVLFLAAAYYLFNRALHHRLERMFYRRR